MRLENGVAGAGATASAERSDSVSSAPPAAASVMAAPPPVSRSGLGEQEAGALLQKTAHTGSDATGMAAADAIFDAGATVAEACRSFGGPQLAAAGTAFAAAASSATAAVVATLTADENGEIAAAAMRDAFARLVAAGGAILRAVLVSDVPCTVCGGVCSGNAGGNNDGSGESGAQGDGGGDTRGNITAAPVDSTPERVVQLCAMVARTWEVAEDAAAAIIVTATTAGAAAPPTPSPRAAMAREVTAILALPAPTVPRYLCTLAAVLSRWGGPGRAVAVGADDGGGCGGEDDNGADNGRGDDGIGGGGDNKGGADTGDDANSDAGSDVDAGGDNPSNTREWTAVADAGDDPSDSRAIAMAGGCMGGNDGSGEEDEGFLARLALCGLLPPLGVEEWVLRALEQQQAAAAALVAEVLGAAPAAATAAPVALLLAAAGTLPSLPVGERAVAGARALAAAAAAVARAYHRTGGSGLPPPWPCKDPGLESVTEISVAAAAEAGAGTAAATDKVETPATPNGKESAVATIARPFYHPLHFSRLGNALRVMGLPPLPPAP
ncbi:unnamed protein product [Phaeothamnion confervicola]